MNPHPNGQPAQDTAFQTIAQGAEIGQLNKEIVAAVQLHNDKPTPTSRQTIERLIARIKDLAPWEKLTTWQPTPDDLAALDNTEIAHRLQTLLQQTRQLDVMKQHETAPPPVPWLVKKWMPDATLTVLTGAGEAGKSRISLQLAVAVAIGAHQFILPSTKKPPLTKTAPQLTEGTQGPVIFAAWETRRTAFANRLIGACGNQTATVEACNDKIHYVNMRRDGGIWGASPGVHTSTAGEILPGGRLLFDYAAEQEARLLILDPLAAAFIANENDRALVRSFLSALDQWADDHSCAVLIISHPPKSDSNQSGSTDWRNGVQAVWTLKAGDDDTRTLAVDKLNEGPKPDSVTVAYEDSRFVAVNSTGETNDSAQTTTASQKGAHLDSNV